MPPWLCKKNYCFLFHDTGWKFEWKRVQSPKTMQLNIFKSKTSYISAKRETEVSTAMNMLGTQKVWKQEANFGNFSVSGLLLKS